MPLPDCSAVATLEERVLEAQQQHGASVRTAVVDSTFLFVDPERTPLFDASLDLARRTLAALRNGRIGAAPLCPVGAYLYATRAAFEDHYRRRGWPPPAADDWGLYDAASGEIVVDLSRGSRHVPTLAHELAHVLISADGPAAAAPSPSPSPPQASEPWPPDWFQECVASLYEAPVFPAEGEIHGVPDWRDVDLRKALAARDPAAHMASLFGMTKAQFHGHMGKGTGRDARLELLHEGVARATCEWLDAQGQLWPFYAAWRDATPPDADGVSTFTRILGRSPADADADWAAWVARGASRK